MLKSLLLLVILNTLWQTGFGIDCWVCSSADAGCGETIDAEILQDNYKTASGCKGCGKKFKSLGTVWYEVERTCLTSASDTCDNKLGYGDCTCSTTFCNGQKRLTNTPILTTLAIVTAIIKWFAV